MNSASRSDAPRALVTGLGGFTGDFLAQSLRAAGYRVFGTTHGSETTGPDMYRVDLCDRAALAQVVADVQPDVVAHLAAIAFVAHGDADAIYRTNVVGTRNLLDALANLQSRPKAVLLASTANIYGNAAVEVIDESVEPNPANDYAVSKRHDLLRRGWPSRVLLLGEVVVSSGEHHLVLLVRTRSGDLVLDNLTSQIKPWSRTSYRWVRVQSPGRDGLWATVGREGV